MKEWIIYWRMIELHICVNHRHTITRVVSSAIKPLSVSKYHFLSQQAKITIDCIRVKIRRPLHPISMLELKRDGSGRWGCGESAEKARRNEFVFPVLPCCLLEFSQHTAHTVCVLTAIHDRDTHRLTHTQLRDGTSLRWGDAKQKGSLVHMSERTRLLFRNHEYGVIMSRKCSHKCRYVLLLTNSFIIQPGSALCRGKAAWNVCKFA